MGQNGNDEIFQTCS